MFHIEGLKPVVAQKPVTLNSTGTATFLSSAVDTADYKYAYVIVSIGTVASGGGISSLKIQTSATSGGTYADISSVTTDFAGAATAASDTNYVARIRLDGQNRYLKVAGTGAGTNKDTALNGVYVILLGARNAPPLSTGAAAIANVY